MASNADVDALDARVCDEFARAFGDDALRDIAAHEEDELARALGLVLTTSSSANDAREACDRVIDLTYAALTVRGTWPRESWRDAYVLAQLRRCAAALRERDDGGETDASRARKAMLAVDMAVIVGAPVEMVSDFVRACEKTLGLDGRRDARDSSARSAPESGWLFPSASPKGDRGDDDARQRLARVHHREMDLKSFKRQYYKTETPVLIESLGEDWPAMRKWDDLQWWRRLHGHRSVPLEIGTYSDVENWREEVKTLTSFIDEYMLPSVSSANAGDVAYLAQHQLVDQLRELADDFWIPEYIGAGSCTSRPEKINVWMGTAGTITPCHFDAYDNLFGQVRVLIDSYFLALVSRESNRSRSVKVMTAW